jgi:phosphatidate cytidylyltransferase
LAAAAALLSVVMAFEWARMQNPVNPMPQAVIIGSGAIACTALSAIGEFHWMAPCLLIFALAAASLRGSWIGRLESFCGAVYVAAPSAVFIWIRNRPEEGLILAFALAIGTWASDIAAYFTGRTFGGPKLLPDTSPQKTWSGFFGGIVAGALAVAIFAVLVGASWPLGLVAGAMISIVGQGGDMFESLVKRHFRVKDSSGLIPGHGGVLDRMDSLMAATLVSALALRWVSTVAPNANLASATPF